MICKSDRPIPSIIGPDQGWHFVRVISSKYGRCCVYDVYDEWHPREATVGFGREEIFYTKVKVGEKVGIDWDKVPLGKVSDAEIAKALGVNRSTVTGARRTRDISRAKVDGSINWDEQPLGKMTDGKLAKKLGVSPNAVRRARVARKIPTFSGRMSA
jgi:hypothetical protein